MKEKVKYRIVMTQHEDYEEYTPEVRRRDGKYMKIYSYPNADTSTMEGASEVIESYKKQFPRTTTYHENGGKYTELTEKEIKE